VAETHSGVDAIATIPVAQVRDALRQTMVLGMPVVEANRPKFFFERQVTYSDFDNDNKPWDWTAAPLTDVTPAPVQPICTWKFFAPLGRQGQLVETAGEFNPTTVVFTFMDVDYDTMVNASNCTIGPNLERKYWFRYAQPESGLGGLGVYQVTFGAEDT
jgi:hypothetical protein